MFYWYEHWLSACRPENNFGALFFHTIEYGLVPDEGCFRQFLRNVLHICLVFHTSFSIFVCFFYVNENSPSYRKKKKEKIYTEVLPVSFVLA